MSKSSAIVIRPPQEQDLPAIAEIYSFEAVLEQTSQLPYRPAEHWRHFYSNKGVPFLELVAICNNRAVGHLGILLNDNPRRKHVASFGIAVHPDYHGQGVGNALMTELIHLADNWLNLLKIELEVSSENGIAIALYKKFGFVMEGESRFDMFRNGRYSHTCHMARFNPTQAQRLNAGENEG